MKNMIKITAAALALGALVPAGFSSCTDMSGDGIDSVLWTGSRNPENTSFRNPVWEPSLEAGTLVKGASMYVALSATTQWTPGLVSLCPALTSNNLMTWSRANDGFAADAQPAWGEGRVNSLSVDYARAVTGATYWMFYTLEGAETIGAASATTAQGPYTDRGAFLTAADAGSTTLRDPFFFVISTAYYLCYTADDGIYIQRLTLNRTRGASLNGAATKIAGTGVGDVCLFRKSSNELYLLFTVGSGTSSEIRYARAEAVTGPYVDKSGTSLTDGSQGEPLIQSGTAMINPENPMRAFLNSEQTHVFVAYNATENGKASMTSGFARKPMLVTPIELTEDGWFKQAVTAQEGWTTPRFE
ncbi:MAG: family 43 glycosylhydrolase [Bacteroidaceae bacterium]|nr:family 43 glycosylhydrolase [Bacteroidaceae bacterium]